MADEPRDEASNAETAQPSTLRYASAPHRAQRWPTRLLGLLCTALVAYIVCEVLIMPGDGQAGFAIVLYSPLCVVPAAFFFARYEADLIGTVLCAASAALGVIVGVAAYVSWRTVTSLGMLVSTLVSMLLSFAIVYVAAFVLACLAALLGFALGRFERLRRRYEPYTCPGCGHFLHSIKGLACPECRRPFTIEELRAAAHPSEHSDR